MKHPFLLSIITLLITSTLLATEDVPNTLSATGSCSKYIVNDSIKVTGAVISSGSSLAQAQKNSDKDTKDLQWQIKKLRLGDYTFNMTGQSDKATGKSFQVITPFEITFNAKNSMDKLVSHLKSKENVMLATKDAIENVTSQAYMDNLISECTKEASAAAKKNADIMASNMNVKIKETLEITSTKNITESSKSFSNNSKHENITQQNLNIDVTVKFKISGR